MAIMVGLASSSAHAAASWVSTSMPWRQSRTNLAIAALPATVAINPEAWAYAAYSAPVDVFGKSQPAILRLTLKVNSGSVGVLLTNLDGKNALSKEASLTPSAQDARVYFRVRPNMPQAMIVLRNFNAPGQAGSVELKTVEFVREGDLDNDELASVMAAGLH